ncbi:phenylacetate--CoA ligase family protein [Acidovorax sp.]|jgi:phenylacetate-CoA ligase|uniref:phenylacetate--CoA ligase family protein n=1 Tax=Acidovorax sp. TaxID=1872122 RepID=UPI003BB0D98C
MHSLPSTDRFESLRASQKNAYDRAPAIRAVYELAKMAPHDLQSPDDLARLAVTNKDALLEMQRQSPPFGGFLAADDADIRRVFVSPGPVYEPQLFDDHTGHGFSHVFRQAGIGPGDRVLNTWSYHLVPAGLLLDEGIAATGATVIPCGPGGAEQQAQIIMELGITCICASTAFFITLVETLERLGYDLPSQWKVRSAMLGGELGDWIGKRRALEEKYAIRTFSAYATGDLGLIAYEEPGQVGYTVQPDRLVQICDPLTGAPLPLGEPGQIVVTTLDRGWPLVRFGTGDVAQALSNSPDGLVERIGMLQGRVGQGVKVREIFIYPRNVEDLIIRTPAIERAQVIAGKNQHRETATLRAVLTPGSSQEDTQSDLMEAFRQLTRLKLDSIEWVTHEDMPIDAPLLVDNKH